MKRFVSILLAIVLCASVMAAGMLSGYAQEPDSGSSSTSSSSSSETEDEKDKDTTPKPPRRMPNNKGDNT